MLDLRRPGQPSDGRDGGFTLIEMLVSMVVFGIAITMVYSALILVQQQVAPVEGSAAAAGQVRQALAQIDRQVRSGNVLYSPENEREGEPDGTVGCQAVSGSNAGTCMRVYTQANGAEKCVQWQVLADGGGSTTSTLRSRGWETDWLTTTPALVVPWDVVARGLVGTPSQAPFTLDTSSAYGSRLLNLRFEAVDPRRGDDPTVLTSSLSGRNTNYGYDAGQCTPVPPST